MSSLRTPPTTPSAISQGTALPVLNSSWPVRGGGWTSLSSLLLGYLLLNTCTYVAVASSTHTAQQCGGGIGSAVPWPAGRVMSYLRALKDGNDTEQ